MDAVTTLRIGERVGIHLKNKPSRLACVIGTVDAADGLAIRVTVERIWRGGKVLPGWGVRVVPWSHIDWVAVGDEDDDEPHRAE